MHLCALALTSRRLGAVDPAEGSRLLVARSTNLENMTHRPLQVLVSSAFWLDTGGLRLAVPQLLLVMAPAERWLGTRRWLTAFAAGHVGATVVTVTGIGYAVHRGLLDQQVAYDTDVGISYGWYAVAGLLTYRFSGRARVAWAAALGGYLVGAACVRRTYTDYGHLTAAAIGLALRRLAPGRDAVRR